MSIHYDKKKHRFHDAFCLLFFAFNGFFDNFFDVLCSNILTCIVIRTLFKATVGTSETFSCRSVVSMYATALATS